MKRAMLMSFSMELAGAAQMAFHGQANLQIQFDTQMRHYMQQSEIQ
jgi:hypothetical protein